MYNLLPYENKKQIKREYRIRLASMVLGSVFVTGVLGALFLLPSYVLTDSKLGASLEREKEILAHNEKIADKNTLRILGDAQRKIDTINGATAAVTAQNLIDKVLSYKTPGVQIIGIDIAKPVNGNRLVTITGIAGTRDGLVDFSKKLQTEKIFTKVVLPVSNFEKNSNIDFALQITSQF